MVFAQISVAACFTVPILFLLALAGHAFITAVRNEMVREGLPAEDGNMARVVVGLVSLLIAAGLITLCAGAVRWLA